MQVLKKFQEKIFSGLGNISQIRGLKYFAPPPNYDGIVIPERAKLKVLERVPQYPPTVKPPRMQKRLRYMRGPELIHNTLQYKQFGIVATCGGRLKHEHFELIRMGILRNIDQKRMFAVWRVDPPWQPVTKKGQGQRMGGGKGAIDHYVTPVKKDRIIIELAGTCEYPEVKKFLQGIACRMPFDAKVVSYEQMLKNERKRIQLEEANINPFSLKYIFQNKMVNSHRWITPFDKQFFGRYR